MEPVTQIYPLLQAALLGFTLLTGGPPLMAGHSAALVAATAHKKMAEQPVAPGATAQVAPAPLAIAPEPVAPPAHGAVATPAPVAPPAPAPVTPAPAKKLKGLAAWSALVGNSAKGESDGEELYEFYARNGIVKQMVGEDKATGKWALKGETVCFDYDNGDGETCYSVAVADGKVTFTDEDDNAVSYEILAGNPKKL